MKTTIAAVAAAGVLMLDAYVAAHGYVQQILLGDSLVEAWNPYKDPQKDPAVQKITRHFLDNGPVTDGEFTVRVCWLLRVPIYIYIHLGPNLRLGLSAVW